MIKNIDIVGIGGSQEENSFSLQILKYTLNEVTLLGARTKLIDIKSLNLPIYDYSGGKLQPQAGLKKIMDDIHKSHGIIFTSPEYHGTVSASFKNFIDYLEFLYSYDPPYLTNKPVGCICKKEHRDYYDYGKSKAQFKAEACGVIEFSE